MVAGIDIGNTTAVLCMIRENQTVFQKKIVPKRSLDLNDWLAEISFADEVLVSSVVPSISAQIQDFCKKIKKKCFLINRTTASLIDFEKYTSDIGADRICTSIGAAFYYGSPVCVIDMGTATTFSLISKDRIYQGGLIMPGIGTLFKSLSSFTSQLPEIQMKEAPSTFLGQNTQENILNGIYYLALEGLSGIIGRIKKENPEVKTVATGGWSNIFNKIYDFTDENLIFKGMGTIYFNQIKQKGG